MADFAGALDTVRREARSSFGDDRVLLERYLVEPRHLEVQLLGDRHGHLVHLFERECSIQRNHQKVIEEAPASFLEPEQRDALYRHALAIGRAIAYDSAGTVEFIHDAHSGETFFLEMNTRLQVEHPVTEATVGIDLVEWQLRVAAGEPLSFAQAELRRSGWAIEARVCAEDPAAGFRPEIGCISGYREPSGDGVRVDSGVRRGSRVTPSYDSMLAKVIAFAETREVAASRLARALDDFELLGVRTNIRFLTDLLRHPGFGAVLSTHYIGRAIPDGWRASGDAEAALAIAALGCALAAHAQATLPPWQTLGAWRLLAHAAPCAMPVLLEDDARNLYETTVRRIDERWEVHTGQIDLDCKASLAGERLEIERDGVVRSFRFHLARDGASESVWLSDASGTHVWRLVDRWQRALVGENHVEADDVVRAPMPGLVTAVPAQLDTRVQAGEALVLIEAMKMLHTLAAPVDGRVAEVRCRVGDAVRGGEILVVIEQGSPE